MRKMSYDSEDSTSSRVFVAVKQSQTYFAKISQTTYAKHAKCVVMYAILFAFIKTPTLI